MVAWHAFFLWNVVSFTIRLITGHSVLGIFTWVFFIHEMVHPVRLFINILNVDSVIGIGCLLWLVLCLAHLVRGISRRGEASVPRVSCLIFALISTVIHCLVLVCVPTCWFKLHLWVVDWVLDFVNWEGGSWWLDRARAWLLLDLLHEPSWYPFLLASTFFFSRCYINLPAWPSEFADVYYEASETSEEADNSNDDNDSVSLVPVPFIIRNAVAAHSFILLASTYCESRLCWCIIK